ncbi:MAG: DUF4382 domain-containing protein [Acidobacteria bacterium]|nr:DUF4382 domain-containing protein [Acidobacteriota bacterium]
MRRNTTTTIAMALFVAAALTGCSGSGSVSFVEMGQIEIHLTDAPIDLSNVTSVTVTIDSVIVYSGVLEVDGSNTSPFVLMTHPETFDLLTLTGGATTLLAEGKVPTGFYQRIRLSISSAVMLFNDGTEVVLKIDSNKVDIPIPFRVEAEGVNPVTLDFDAAASVLVNDTSGNRFILRPVVTPVQM